MSAVQPNADGEEERIEYGYLPPHVEKLRLDLLEDTGPEATAAAASASSSSASSAGPSNAGPSKSGAESTGEKMRRRAEARADAVSVTAFFDETERSERALELFLEAQFEADDEIATALRSHIDVEHISNEDLDAIIDQVGYTRR